MHPENPLQSSHCPQWRTALSQYARPVFHDFHVYAIFPSECSFHVQTEKSEKTNSKKNKVGSFFSRTLLCYGSSLITAKGVMKGVSLYCVATNLTYNFNIFGK